MGGTTAGEPVRLPGTAPRWRIRLGGSGPRLVIKTPSCWRAGGPSIYGRADEPRNLLLSELSFFWRCVRLHAQHTTII